MAPAVDDVDELAAAVASIYREAETALTRLVARRLMAGVESPTWAQDKAAEVATLRRAATLVVRQLQVTGNTELRNAVAAAYRSGSVQALADAAALVDPGLGVATSARQALRGARRGTRERAGAVRVLGDALVAEVRPLYAAILPQVMGAYREVVAAATARTLTGVQSRRQAAQSAYARLVTDGITGYTDTAGRRWRLHTWVEMATRTAAHRAQVAAVVDALTDAGHRLVYVPNSAAECDRCRPYEHQVLALWGPTGDIELPNERTGRLTVVHVKATLDEAQDDGLHHPNCRHPVSAYRQGITNLTGETADPAGDLAQQRQRAIERHIRHWKERQVGALGPLAAQFAALQVHRWDKAMGQHLTDNPKLTRLRYREDIGAGHVPPPGRVADAAGRLHIPTQRTVDRAQTQLDAAVARAILAGPPDPDETPRPAPRRRRRIRTPREEQSPP